MKRGRRGKVGYGNVEKKGSLERNIEEKAREKRRRGGEEEGEKAREKRKRGGEEEGEKAREGRRRGRESEGREKKGGEKAREERRRGREGEGREVEKKGERKRGKERRSAAECCSCCANTKGLCESLTLLPQTPQHHI